MNLSLQCVCVYVCMCGCVCVGVFVYLSKIKWNQNGCEQHDRADNYNFQHIFPASNSSNSQFIIGRDAICFLSYNSELKWKLESSSTNRSKQRKHFIVHYTLVILISFSIVMSLQSHSYWLNRSMKCGKSSGLTRSSHMRATNWKKRGPMTHPKSVEMQMSDAGTQFNRRNTLNTQKTSNQ